MSGTPVVSGARVSDRGILYVTFSDKHELQCIPNSGGFGVAHDLEAVVLSNASRPIATFHSPRQYPVQRQPFGFYKVASGYTAEKIAAYWQAAVDYLAARSKSELAEAWFIIALGVRDLAEIKAGTWPIPR